MGVLGISTRKDRSEDAGGMLKQFLFNLIDGGEKGGDGKK